MPKTNDRKKRRGSFLKIRRGRGQGATWYIVDTYRNGTHVVHEGIKTRAAAEKTLKQLKSEEDYRVWIWLRSAR